MMEHPAWKHQKPSPSGGAQPSLSKPTDRPGAPAIRRRSWVKVPDTPTQNRLQHYNPDTTHGTYMYMPISWGGWLGVNWSPYDSPMECLRVNTLANHKTRESLPGDSPKEKPSESRVLKMAYICQYTRFVKDCLADNDWQCQEQSAKILGPVILILFTILFAIASWSHHEGDWIPSRGGIPAAWSEGLPSPLQASIRTSFHSRLVWIGISRETAIKEWPSRKPKNRVMSTDGIL